MVKAKPQIIAISEALFIIKSPLFYFRRELFRGLEGRYGVGRHNDRRIR